MGWVRKGRMGWGREAVGKKEAGKKVEMIELEKWVRKVGRGRDARKSGVEAEGLLGG